VVSTQSTTRYMGWIFFFFFFFGDRKNKSIATLFSSLIAYGLPVV
jgi:hypothetical protein